MNTDQLLNTVSQKNVSYILDQKFYWFNNVLLPSIEKGVVSNKETLSYVWYLVGDVYDMIDAPLKALESYKKAILTDDSNYAAYREIANVLDQIGKYDEALKYINKALDINPFDSDSLSDKKVIEENVKYNSPPLYESSDSIWSMNEHLASKNFDFVVESLKNSDNIEYLMLLAKAYGALEMKDKYLETWNKINSSSAEFEISYGDWFYMPKDVYESKEIWILFKSMNDRIKPSISIHFDSLSKYYGKNMTAKESRSLVFDYFIYLFKNDIEQLSAMKKKFPKWKELSKY